MYQIQTGTTGQFNKWHWDSYGIAADLKGETYDNPWHH
jgi:hypothetical protein